MTEQDERWMRQALALAEKGRGRVEPNPLVGAVLVRDDVPVGAGFHERFGGPHAEVNALAEAGERARGATLYCTLEPCCHHGKTPPCTDAILHAGITRVVIPLSDPFPEVGGQGIAQLRAAGITVDVGVCETEARRQNAPFLTLIQTGRPYVHAKWAMTLDGKIATRTGDSRWISNEASRRRTHELRGRMDAIIAGIGTVLADDPLLTVRPPGPRTPVRVVLDSRGRIPLDSQLVLTARDVPVLVAADAGTKDETVRTLQEHGVEVFRYRTTDQMAAVGHVLEELGRRRMTNVLIEGGAGVLGSFLDARAIDEVHVFIAPCLLGGGGAKGPIAGRGVDRIADALPLRHWEVEQIDNDVLLRGWR